MATELQDLVSILHLIFHRNHNQHRQQLWWRDFNSFRRQLQQHVTDADILEGNVPVTKVRGSKSSVKKSSVKKRSDERLVFWAAELVPRWYRSFAQLVASTQFAAMGLVLMAILARVSHLVGITQRYEEEADRGMQRVLQTFAEKDARTLFEERNRPGGTSISNENEDVGEVVARDEQKPTPAPAASSAPAPESASASAPRSASASASTPAPAKKKPKKRKKNPIDDLFAGL